MRAVVLAVVVGCSVLVGSALAQERTVPGATFVMVGDGCPVGFSAEVSARAVMHSVDEDKKYGTAPALELAFVPKGGTRVVKAKVTVHGLPVGSRVMEVSGKDDGVASEQFELVAAKGLGEREVRVMKLGVVRWAEVTEMWYGDGTTWKAAKGEVCRARPPLYKEVNAVVGR